MSSNHHQPPLSKQKKALNQMILKLTEQDYASKQFAVTGTSSTTLGISVVAGSNKGSVAIGANEIQ